MFTILVGSAAQPQGFAHDEVTLASSLSSALAYSFAEVVCDARHQRAIKLSREQSETIARLQLEFAGRSNQLLLTSLGVEEGEHIELSLDEAVRRQEPYRPEIERQEREFVRQLRAQLLPTQIDAAQAIVMRERYRIGGLRAVLASEDLPLDTLGLEQAPADIKEHLDRALRAAYKDVEKLHNGYSKASWELGDKIQQLALESIQTSLDKLGGDGETIKRLLERLSTEFNPTPDDSSIANALKYGLVSAIVNSFEKNSLELTAEQKQRVWTRYQPFASRRDKLVGEALGWRGSEFDADVFGIPHESLDPALFEQILQEERDVARQIRAEMNPKQIEAAELSVLRQRYSQAGLRAVLESSDLDLVSKLRFDRPLAEIKAHIADAVAKAQPQIDVIHAESARAFADYTREVDKINQLALNAALGKLGSDGTRLHELITRWE